MGFEAQGQVAGEKGVTTATISPLDSLPKRARQRLAVLKALGRDGYEEDLLKMVTGDEATLTAWGCPLTPEERAQRNDLIFDLWLAGETTTAIAEKLHLQHPAIVKILRSVTAAKLEAWNIPEQPNVYNVWNYSSCDKRFGEPLPGHKAHPGRIPGQAVLNLLLRLTKPYGLVVDPMVGGGTTIDVCKYLLRRYRCFDIDPKRPDIKKWDIRQGYPHLPQKPDFIFLDPPYWRLKRDEYSGDGAAMGSYEEWLAFMKKLARDSFKTVRAGGHVGLMVESFLDERETGRFLFLNRDCLGLFESAGFEGIQEFAVNMPSQIKTNRDVEYARRKGIWLDLKRELFLFRRNASEKAEQ